MHQKKVGNHWVGGVSQFTPQNTAQMIVGMTSILVTSKQAHQYGVNITEANSHVICNFKAITVRSFDIN